MDQGDEHSCPTCRTNPKTLPAQEEKCHGTVLHGFWNRDQVETQSLVNLMTLTKSTTAPAAENSNYSVSHSSAIPKGTGNCNTLTPSLREMIPWDRQCRCTLVSERCNVAQSSTGTRVSLISELTSRRRKQCVTNYQRRSKSRTANKTYSELERQIGQHVLGHRKAVFPHRNHST